MAMHDVTNGVEATYKNAITSALDSAKFKAQDAREECGHSPIDHASQAALENSPLTGKRFETAYDEVFQTTWYLIGERELSTTEAAKRLEQVRVELLRVTYDN